MKEHYYDDLLNIRTRGEQEETHHSFHYYRYEPTPYSALEVLFKQYELKSHDHIVDFGCGKGRLVFYLHYLSNCSTVGVEMSGDLYQQALENRKGYLKKMRKGGEGIRFFHGIAEEYPIDPLDNRFYFFNPFSIQIFMNIVKNILISMEQSEREVELILYYCSDDYLYFLENQTLFELKQEIILPRIYDHNPYERFLIYRLDNRTSIFEKK
ncbi:SAM-dependent methyltransferase [Cytobacillus sp. Hz8]|uniref:SAM-dependent methyltransferase n=1 Tax=Cytobacillus sp. Hz8 TaxID=3347168 RepID=UPI0035E09B2C